LANPQVKKIYAVTTHSESLISLTSASSGKLTLLNISVSDAKTPAMLKEALSNTELDLLINCAGVYPVQKGGFESLTLEHMDQGTHVNTYSVMFTLQGCLEALKRAKHPVIVSMTSLMGSIADNTSGGSYSYRMSKAALNMFNKCFSIEYPKWVSVVFHPGWVKTEMGGDQAPTTIDESVAGMLKKISQLKSSDNGKFFDFEGEVVSW